jgi:hypothetical protein
MIMLFQKLKFWVKKEPEVDIQDGVIISEGSTSRAGHGPGIDANPSDHLPDTVIMDLGSVSDPEPEPVIPAPESTPVFYPPAVPVYSPSYIETGAETGDYGLFHHYLAHSKYTTRTRDDYLADIRLWKEACAGKFPDSDLIENTTRKLSALRALRMLTALKCYARYRNLHGDPRLMVLFATTLRLKRPKAPPKAPKKELHSTEQLTMYQGLAKQLCLDGKRTGIWIGLSMIGVKSSAMRFIRVDGAHIIVDDKRIPAPAWLVEASMTIDRGKWERSNNTIRKGMVPYGTNPHHLYMSAATAEFHLS